MEKSGYFASNLRYLRLTNKKTLEDVGKFVNKTRSAICKWESGEREPYAIDIYLVSQFFNVSIDDLVLKDLRLENVEIEEGNYITMPKDYKKFKKGERVPVQDVLDYVEEMQDKIDKIWENLNK